MELNKAIERLKNTDIYNLGHNDRFEELRLYENAINTVLEELNNRIPREYIEDKIEKVRCETTWNYNDWKYDEKVYRAEHNMINIIEKEILNKE